MMAPALSSKRCRPAGDRPVARKAVSVAGETDYLELHAHALLGLAEVLRLADRNQDAFSAVHAALDLHRRKGNVVAEARAALLLEELGG